MAAAPVYAFWWNLMERCSGRTGRLSSVSWFVAPQIHMGGQHYGGYWWENGNRILLAESRILDGPIVRHEMLHALLQDGDHPPEYFGSRCGSEVGCPDCVESSFGATPAEREQAIDVTPSLLQVSVEAAWPDPELGVEPGRLAIIVTARNPSSQPLWVRLPTHLTFGYHLHGPTIGYTSSERSDERRYFFGPGQERRMVSDEHFWCPGTYTVRGFFGDALSDELRFEIPAMGSVVDCGVDLGRRDQSQPPTSRSASQPSTSRAIIGT